MPLRTLGQFALNALPVGAQRSPTLPNPAQRSPTLPNPDDSGR